MAETLDKTSSRLDTSSEADKAKYLRAPQAPPKQSLIEHAFESAMWTSRLMVISAVVASIVVAFGAFYISTVDVIYLLAKLPGYASQSLSAADRLDLRAEIVTSIVKAIDGYLLGAIMLIFGFGLYELFVNKIDQAENSDFANRLLKIKNIDDLKNRLAKVVMLILVIKFFQQALDMKYESVLDLLWLALGTFLLGAALYISSLKTSKE